MSDFTDGWKLFWETFMLHVPFTHWLGWLAAFSVCSLILRIVVVFTMKMVWR